MENEILKNKTPKEYSFAEYDSLKTFISYFYQIDSVIKTKPGSVLEIGIGNGTVSDYLRKTGIQVTTCDSNKNLFPDVVADVRKLPFKDGFFDSVLACQVLEHIPFDDFEKALFELNRVSRKNVIISLPDTYYYAEGTLKIVIPFFERQIHFLINFPFLRKKIVNKEEHFWEIGLKKFPKNKIVKILNKYFKTIKEFKPILNANRHFFILEK